MLGVALAGPVSATGGPEDVGAMAPDSLQVVLVTAGPGPAVWERFGHNALWIRDETGGISTAYHYGVFDLGSEGFILEFIRGRMFYSMGSAEANRFIRGYRRAGRAVTLQRLRLTQEQSRRLMAFLEWNLRPENRVYRYDYFRDNCSTRIRDALDAVLGGRLRAALSADSTAVTYREEAVALTTEDPLLATAIDLGLGPLADRRLTGWELAFIPMRLRDAVRDIVVRRNGVEVPLVASERYLPASDRAPAERPGGRSTRTRTFLLLLLGLLTGGAFTLAGSVAGRSAGFRGTGRAGRWVLAVGGTVWGLVSGVSGLLLLGLWVLTDHEFAWRNENLLQMNPLALALVVLVPLTMIGGRGRSVALALAGLLAGLSAVGLLLNPLTPQVNLAIIAFALPLNLGLFIGLREVGRPTVERAEP
jgi:hypothetical protein